MSHSNKQLIRFKDDSKVYAFDKALVTLFVIICVIVFVVMVAPMLGGDKWSSFGSLLSWLLSSGL